MVSAKLRLGACSNESLDKCCRKFPCLTISIEQKHIPSKWEQFSGILVQASKLSLTVPNHAQTKITVEPQENVLFMSCHTKRAEDYLVI